MSARRGTTVAEMLVALGIFAGLVALGWGLMRAARHGQAEAERDAARVAAAVVQERIEADLGRLAAAPGTPPVVLAPDGRGIGFWMLADRAPAGTLPVNGVAYRTVPTAGRSALERSGPRPERLGAPHVSAAQFALTTAGDALRVTLTLAPGDAHTTFAVRLPRLAGDRDTFRPELHTLKPGAPFPVPDLAPPLP